MTHDNAPIPAGEPSGYADLLARLDDWAPGTTAVRKDCLEAAAAIRALLAQPPAGDREAVARIVKAQLDSLGLVDPDFVDADKIAGCVADALLAALRTPPVESEAVALREVEGPQPLPARYSCFGCKHLLEERWREPSGDGETFDSGDSATCMAITTEHGGKNISAYWGRNNPPPTWCPKPLRTPAADPTGEA